MLLSEDINQVCLETEIRCSFEFWGKCSAEDSVSSFSDIHRSVYGLWSHSLKEYKSISYPALPGLFDKPSMCPSGKHNVNQPMLSPFTAQWFLKSTSEGEKRKAGAFSPSG